MSGTNSAQFDAFFQFLRQGILTSDLLPQAYAHYLPLLADGLCFFLGHLGSERLTPIFSEQAQLLSAPIQRRIVALLHHLPTLHKLGQVLSRDHRLQPDFRAYLQQLETFEPRLPGRDFPSLLDSEIRNWRRLGIRLETKPLAEGSVAVVVPFTWNSNRKPARKGVFKLLKPGIKDLLEEDLAVWGKLGAFLDDSCDQYHLPPLDYRETFDIVTDLLRHEVRLDQEQLHLAAAAKTYASYPSVVIPEVFPFCTPRLTAMEFLDGAPLTKHLMGDANSEVRQLAPIIPEALVAMPLFSKAVHSFFHGDPHAGNLFLTKGGRLGILDWSLVGKLDKSSRIHLIQLVLGGLTQNLRQLFEAVEGLSTTIPDRCVLHPVLSKHLQRVRWGQVPGATWLIELLDEVVLRAKVKLSSNLLLFRKTLLTLNGVLTDVCGGAAPATTCLDGALVQRFLHQFLMDWPQRLFQPPHSRVSSTHLSNQDLFALLYSTPLTMARYISGAWLDICAPSVKSRLGSEILLKVPP